MQPTMGATSAIRTGFIGGPLARQLLQRVGRRAAQESLDTHVGAAYQCKSKLEVLFGPDIWREIAGKRVIDMGCGGGLEAVEMARRGAARVTGIDIRETSLRAARGAAAAAAVSERCTFAAGTDERADVIVSIDGFEHYEEPGGMLLRMRELLMPGGRVLVAFGPPWFHPLGGHLFSVFPWAHLVFTERALIRWRAGFKHDGATRFGEVAGGLNQMTVRRFERLIARSGFAVEAFEAVPIRRLAPLSNRLTRELFTSIVRCRLVAMPAPR